MKLFCENNIHTYLNEQKQQLKQEIFEKEDLLMIKEALYRDQLVRKYLIPALMMHWDKVIKRVEPFEVIYHLPFSGNQTLLMMEPTCSFDDVQITMDKKVEELIIRFTKADEHVITKKWATLLNNLHKYFVDMIQKIADYNDELPKLVKMTIVDKKAQLS